MNIELIVALVGGFLFLSGLLILAYKKVPKRVRMHKNVAQWRSIQQLLADQRTWPDAVVQADVLLDKTMKNKRCDGKTTGERMVSCQNKFSNNDALWRAHKLANKVREGKEQVEIKENEMKSTMLAFGQGMKDLGAL